MLLFLCRTYSETYIIAVSKPLSIGESVRAAYFFDFGATWTLAQAAASKYNTAFDELLIVTSLL
jgi:hypothetical protein